MVTNVCVCVCLSRKRFLVRQKRLDSDSEEVQVYWRWDLKGRIAFTFKTCASLGPYTLTEGFLAKDTSDAVACGLVGEKPGGGGGGGGVRGREGDKDREKAGQPVSVGVRRKLLRGLWHMVHLRLARAGPGRCALASSACLSCLFFSSRTPSVFVSQTTPLHHSLHNPKP